MSNKLKVSVFFALCCAVWAAPGWSQFYFQEPPAEKPFTGQVMLDFASQYIRRGVEFNGEAVFQPVIRLNEKALEVEAMGTMDLTNGNENRNEFTEYRLRGGLARRGAAADFAFSYIYYGYPNTERSKTQELALEIAVGYPSMVGFDAYWDIDRADGFYFRSSLGHVFEVSIFKIVPRVALGWATKKYQRYYFEVSQNSFVDFEAALKLEAALGAGFALMAEGLYYDLVRGDLRDSQKGKTKGEHFWGRGALIYRF